MVVWCEEGNVQNMECREGYIYMQGCTTWFNKYVA